MHCCVGRFERVGGSFPQKSLQSFAPLSSLAIVCVPPVTLTMAKITTTLADLDEINAANSATRVMAGNSLFMDGALVTDWDITTVCNWLVHIGYKDLVPIFQRSNINGVALARLNDRLLKEIGVHNVGTRLQFMNEVIKIQAVSRSAWRNNVLWTEEEYRPNWCFYLLPYDFPCCCCTFTSEYFCGRPDVYTITHSRLNVISERFVADQLCCFLASRVESNNTDLSQIIDVDCFASTANCGEPVGVVKISTLDGSTTKIKVRSSSTQTVTSLLNSVKDESLIAVHLIHPPKEEGKRR